MYKSLVLPYFGYCSLVWGNCNNTLNVARVISGDTYDIRSEGILRKFGWRNLDDRRTSQILSHVNKALHKKCPNRINEIFELSENEKYNLRSNNLMLMLSKPNTNAMKRSFSYAAAKIWNTQYTYEKSKVLTNVDS